MGLSHELGGAIPLLGALLNVPAQPTGGSTSTVGRANYRYDRPNEVSHGATVRVVVELAEVPRVSAVIPGGQSGHFLSPHYSDQFQKWLAGELIPVFDTAAAAGEPAVTLRPLRPEPAT